MESLRDCIIRVYSDTQRGFDKIVRNNFERTSKASAARRAEGRMPGVLNRRERFERTSKASAARRAEGRMPGVIPPERRAAAAWQNEYNQLRVAERCRSGRTGLTRNQVYGIPVPWVRIPPSPPEHKNPRPGGVFLVCRRGWDINRALRSSRA